MLISFSWSSLFRLYSLILLEFHSLFWSQWNELIFFFEVFFSSYFLIFLWNVRWLNHSGIVLNVHCFGFFILVFYAISTLVFLFTKIDSLLFNVRLEAIELYFFFYSSVCLLCPFHLTIIRWKYSFLLRYWRKQNERRRIKTSIYNSNKFFWVMRFARKNQSN